MRVWLAVLLCCVCVAVPVINVAPEVVLGARDDRLMMAAGKDQPFDEDYDSPQIGEKEDWPQADKTSFDMNTNTNPSTFVMKEGVEGEMLSDHPDFIALAQDHPSAFSGTPLQHPSDFVEPVDSANEVPYLPNPNKDVAKRNKIAQTFNAHDIPPVLDQMDEDCGMPEPSIPCETPGNTTKCVPKMQLGVPAIPEAELMPPIPIPAEYTKPAERDFSISVEFVDFGTTRQVDSHISNSVAQVVEEAGQEWGVTAWSIQLVRSSGIDVNPDSTVHDLDDKKEIIVYLMCIYRRFESQLIMHVPACEDMFVRNLTAYVEIPAFQAVYPVTVMSTEHVLTALARTPIPIDDIESVTYDGNNVTLDSPLEYLEFRNGSALVVYPKEPCPPASPSPSHTPSPEPSPSTLPPTPTASPIPNKTKNRKFGAYDVYRHCKNSKGERVEPPHPLTLGLHDSADPNDKSNLDEDIICEESEMTDEEKEEDEDIVDNRIKGSSDLGDLPRTPMTQNAVITVKFGGKDIPVRIKPVATGLDIFDAVTRATGVNHKYFQAVFMDRPIDHYTKLRPFGFRDGDVVLVSSQVNKEDYE